MTGPRVWLDYDQEALDSQYNQRALVPDADDYIAVDVAESKRVREKLECRIDVAYGPSEDEKLDLFPARAPGSPMAVYMHGGAWTRSDKANESFMAEAFVEAGAAFVAANFGLCPKVTLDEMIRQARAAVAWSHANARDLNADPGRLYIAGHSSGGHVGGMMAVTDWQAAPRPPARPGQGRAAVQRHVRPRPRQAQRAQRLPPSRRGGRGPQQRDPPHPARRLPAGDRLWRRRAEGVPPPVEGVRRRLARRRGWKSASSTCRASTISSSAATSTTPKARSSPPRWR